MTRRSSSWRRPSGWRRALSSRCSPIVTDAGRSYGQGRLEAALENVVEAARLDPTGKFILMTRTVFLQALGRTEDARDMLRRTRELRPGEPLEFWVGLARGSYMSETMFKSYSKHFIDVWNATPVETP